MPTFEFNELNKNSKGGSELMYMRLKESLEKKYDAAFLDNFQIVLSRVRDVHTDRHVIYWVHDLPGDPETVHLQENASRDRFKKIVFCGQWQAQAYRSVLGVPFNNTTVIETGIYPVEYKPKVDNEVRLIYTSTPQRGLELLYPVFNALAEKYDNIHLDVFSSFKIYGWGEADKQYETLFENLKNHPKITYHGFQPNEVVREYLQKAHILAYPSIWMECNSQSLIEAMSAGCLCVHPNLGGLTDTAGGLTMMYDFDEDHNIHANRFAGVLSHAIEQVNNSNVQNYLGFVKTYADHRYNWLNIFPKWDVLLNSILAQHGDPTVKKFTYKTP
jgi:UDP-glucose:(glucosyl)LPS alpha-1,2-glucosyltransferase